MLDDAFDFSCANTDVSCDKSDRVSGRTPHKSSSWFLRGGEAFLGEPGYYVVQKASPLSPRDRQYRMHATIAWWKDCSAEADRVNLYKSCLLL